MRHRKYMMKKKIKGYKINVQKRKQKIGIAAIQTIEEMITIFDFCFSIYTFGMNGIGFDLCLSDR